VVTLYIYSHSEKLLNIRVYVAGGSTVNVCLLDLSKAFDKMNHLALYLKLMDRSVPVQLHSVHENWLSMCMSCHSCVKWGLFSHIIMR